MHDANGEPLSVGDVVMIPCRVIQLSGGEEYCNVTLETVLTRRPDGKRETIGGINTRVMVKSPKMATVANEPEDGERGGTAGTPFNDVPVPSENVRAKESSGETVTTDNTSQAQGS